MTHQPRWLYNEFRQVGLDFEDEHQVAEYDKKQGSDPEAEKQLIERLDIKPGQVVIDIGCGTGSFSIAAARHGAQVHAVDVSQTMLRYIERQCLNQDIQSVKLHHAGFLSYRHEDAPADWIISRYALHHLPDTWKQVALMNLSSMLGSAGRFYLRDVVFSFHPSCYKTHLSDWISQMSHISGYACSEFETHLREEYSTFSWVIEGMLERAGYKIDWVDYPSSMYAEYVCHRIAEA